ncbi:MAG: hypothetical protein E7005_05065 [Alphaproteobacteria bacterium]|nr:hypothetical protein [Alphaproteobacteria bacterium]
MKNNDLGRSMIEMLGVLAIVGVLSVGGIAGYSKAMVKFKTNKLLDQITQTITNIQTMFAQSRDYRGLSNDTAIGAQLVPAEMIINNSIINVFGGEVYIAASKTDSRENGAFIVAFYDIPKSACIDIGSNNIPVDDGGLIAFSFGLGNDDEGSDFSLHDFTESSEPVYTNSATGEQMCDCDIPGHPTCPYPPAPSSIAGIFGSTCTLAWKFF